ncbi:MAG: Nudix family hydrolase, partial [Gammaproteobacteria bacterium]|nr:Nudix family hydrolase [Gammaproteobacteria bacterium]
LYEELDIEATHFTPLIRIHHDYGDKQVLLDVWTVSRFEGAPQGREGQEIIWVSDNELEQYDFPAANAPIVTAAQLPDTYLITPEPEDINKFLTELENTLKHDIHMVQLRAKRLSDEEYIGLAERVLRICHKHKAKLLLNHNIDILQHVDADGIHLSSAKLSGLDSINMPKQKLLSASCHNEDEIEKANELGIDFVLVSPVMPTLSHPGAATLDWRGLYRLSEQAKMPVYALGGMDIDDIEQARTYGAQGIATIRSLWSALC